MEVYLTFADAHNEENIDDNKNNNIINYNKIIIVK